MSNKSQKGKKAKAKAKNKEKNKERKKIEKVYGNIIRSNAGQKRVINPKRHKKKAFKGTRKNKK